MSYSTNTTMYVVIDGSYNRRMAIITECSDPNGRFFEPSILGFVKGKGSSFTKTDSPTVVPQFPNERLTFEGAEGRLEQRVASSGGILLKI